MQWHFLPIILPCSTPALHQNFHHSTYKLGITFHLPSLYISYLSSMVFPTSIYIYSSVYSLYLSLEGYTLPRDREFGFLQCTSSQYSRQRIKLAQLVLSLAATICYLSPTRRESFPIAIPGHKNLHLNFWSGSWKRELARAQNSHWQWAERLLLWV